MTSNRLEQLTKLHAADPADPFCTYGIALEHAKARRFDDAIAWLDKTLTIDPAYCYAYYQKAKTLNEMSQPDAARTTLEAGMQAAIQAGDAHARDEMAELLANIG